MLTPNLERIKETLDRIVFKSAQPVVVALKGGWGEGKTFFWKNNAVSGREHHEVGYVSVFGADSLQTIRERALLAALPRLHADAASILGRAVEVIRQHAPVLLKRFGVPDTLATQLLESTALRPGWVVCLDDIERLSGNVAVDAFLGYINELRDERRIKVVLIYNDEGLGDKDAAFRRYQEKVIDRELPFSPDISGVLQLVFRAIPRIADDSRLLEELARRCGVLNLKNIRLIVKARNYCQELEQVLPLDADPKFRDAALFSLLLFVWIKFSKQPIDALTLDFLSSYSQLSTMLDKDSTKTQRQPNDTDHASDLLTEYGYTFTDDLDTILIDFVRTDTLDIERLLREYEKYSLSLSKGILEQRFSEAWHKYYHGTLRNTEAEFCDALVSGARDYMEFIPVNQLDAALNMLSRLGRKEAAEQLLADFLRLRGDSLRDFRRGDLMEPIKYKKLDEVLRAAEQESSVDRRSIGDVVDGAVAEDFLRAADRKRLAQFSKQDFVDYFSGSDQEHLTSRIRQLANQAARFANPDVDDIKIQTTVREAVAEIAAQHRLNRMRMESMGLVRSEKSGE